MSDIGPIQPLFKYIPIDPEITIFKLHAVELSRPNGLKARCVGEMTHDEMLFIDLLIGRRLVTAR